MRIKCWDDKYSIIHNFIVGLPYRTAYREVGDLSLAVALSTDDHRMRVVDPLLRIRVSASYAGPS